MIPDFDENGNLPPGVYSATLLEIGERFGYNNHRKTLFNALNNVIRILVECNCKEAYLNGSFIADNAQPNDYDLCFEPMGITPTEELRQILEDLRMSKKKYLGDIFIRFPEPPFYFDHVNEWQKDRDGNTKGIIKLMIGREI